MDAFEGTLFSDRFLADVAALADDDLHAARERVAGRYERSRRDGTNREQVVESVLTALGGRPSTVTVVTGPPDGRAAVQAHADRDRGDGDDPRAAVTDGRRWRLLLADEPPDRHLDVDLAATLDAPERFAVFAVTFGPRGAFERVLDAREAHVSSTRTDLKQSLQEAVRQATGRLLGPTDDANGADDANGVKTDEATDDSTAA